MLFVCSCCCVVLVGLVEVWLWLAFVAYVEFVYCFDMCASCDGCCCFVCVGLFGLFVLFCWVFYLRVFVFVCSFYVFEIVFV